jgi:hypothetical protein
MPTMAPEVVRPGSLPAAGAGLRPAAAVPRRVMRRLMRRWRIADAVLEVAASWPVIFDELDARYGECATAVAGDTLARVLCSVEADDDDAVRIEFHAPRGIDAHAAALALLEHPAPAPLYHGLRTRDDGWGCIVRADDGAVAVTTRGSTAWVDRSRVPAEFLVDLVVAQAAAAQRNMLFVHAASVVVDGEGVLLCGESGRGKTTLALALAARGHGYLGDDIAAVRTATRELVALRTTANVRPGLRAQAVDDWIDTNVPGLTAPRADGLPRWPVSVAHAFPAAAAGPAPLRRVLFLRGFAAAPAVERFRPSLADWAEHPTPPLNGALWLSWATTPALRLLQFLLFARLLSTLRCEWLDAGSPDATAELIERTMEAS